MFNTGTSRIEKEKRIIGVMIRIYCRKKEGNEELCDHCQALLDYAVKHLSHCPFGEHKKSCRHCTIHCYSPEMRERIRLVMRFSGPRMILYAPFEILRHI